MLSFIRRYVARRQINGSSGEQASPESAAQLIAAGEEPTIGAAEIEMTPFFASIHGYVGLAEQVPLMRLSELMNAYFEACTTEIQNEGGTIDKYIGDAIVAMFGAPLRNPDHALRACIAALKCQARMGELRERLSREGDKWPEQVRQLRVRIGLHTGTVIVGHMGTKSRFNYTMMGDNVNLAARMEAAAKSWGVWTLCTETTRNACEKSSPGRILFRSLGRIVVKGRVGLLEVFEPIALRENVTDRDRECVRIFERGLARWRERDRPGAIAFFEESARIEPHQIAAGEGIASNPSTVFLKMAREDRDNPDTESIS